MCPIFDFFISDQIIEEITLKYKCHEIENRSKTYFAFFLILCKSAVKAFQSDVTWVSNLLHLSIFLSYTVKFPFRAFVQMPKKFVELLTEMANGGGIHFYA